MRTVESQMMHRRRMERLNWSLPSICGRTWSIGLLLRWRAPWGGCRAGWLVCWPACLRSQSIGSLGGFGGWACAILSWRFRSFPRANGRAFCDGVYVYLGWQLVEFCRMTRYTAQNTGAGFAPKAWSTILQRRRVARGFWWLPGHLGAWELSSFYHSLMGYPMGMVIRRLDNRRLDEYVNSIRCLHGNRVLHKDDFGAVVAVCHACGADCRHSDGH